jgi:ATP-dependent Clp protease ATP-binding subunit ClpA
LNYGDIDVADDARDVFVAAAARARALGHDCLGTEHLLLALITAAPSVLGSDDGATRAEAYLSARVVQKEPIEDSRRELRYTDDAVRALQSMFTEARKNTPAVLTPRHVALALRAGDDLAAEALNNIGFAASNDGND